MSKGIYDAQQKILRGKFDIEIHKKTFVNYLEVVIREDGTVEYAAPSHQEKMIRIAIDLYNAGYRKQSEKDSSKGCEYCKGRAYTKKPLTVITKYGRRIELVFEFCPNCGRNMKGGAE